MSPKLIPLLFILSFSDTVNAQNFGGVMHAGGELLWIGVAIISFIIWAIKSAYKKVDEKVDDYKLNRNPTDIKTNEKKLLQKFEHGDTSEIETIAQVIYDTDANNFLGTSVMAIKKHEDKSYNESRALLEQAVQGIEGGQYRKLLFRHFNVDCQRPFEKQVISKIYYYYGHTFSMNGNIDEANKYKKRGKQYNKEVLALNLY